MTDPRVSMPGASLRASVKRPAKARTKSAEQTPHLAEVRHVHGRPIRAVELELEELLIRARAGDVIGIGYVTVNRRQVVHAGLAGTLAKDKWKATGAFFHAAMHAAEKDDPHA